MINKELALWRRTLFFASAGFLGGLAFTASATATPAQSKSVDKPFVHVTYQVQDVEIGWRLIDSEEQLKEMMENGRATAAAKTTYRMDGSAIIEASFISADGDWPNYCEYRYRPDGTLYEIDSNLATPGKNIRIKRKYRYEKPSPQVAGEALGGLSASSNPIMEGAPDYQKIQCPVFADVNELPEPQPVSEGMPSGKLFDATNYDVDELDLTEMSLAFGCSKHSVQLALVPNYREVPPPLDNLPLENKSVFACATRDRRVVASFEVIPPNAASRGYCAGALYAGVKIRIDDQLIVDAAFSDYCRLAGLTAIQIEEGGLTVCGFDLNNGSPEGRCSDHGPLNEFLERGDVITDGPASSLRQRHLARE